MGNGQRRAGGKPGLRTVGRWSRQALEIDFFLRRCLQHVEEQRKLQALDSRSSSTLPRKRDESGDAHLRWNGCGRLGLVSRAGFYQLEGYSDDDGRGPRFARLRFSGSRWDFLTMAGRASPPNWRSAAARPIHKRVYRIMREDNLLCLRRRKFVVVVTTNSNHTRPIYPNLARGAGADRNQPALGGRYHLHPAGVGVRLPWR